MHELSVPHPHGRDALRDGLKEFVEVCGGLSDHELLAASRCWGWSVLDVVVHVRAGLQEMLGGVVSGSQERPDTDAASYWSAPPPADDVAADHIDALLWTRRTASAYRRPTSAVAQLRDVAATVSTAVDHMPVGAVRFQGHVLTTGDFLATWAVELAVHHLDLGRHLDVAPPAGAALPLARATIEALVGRTVPDGLDDVRTVLLGAGRASAAGEERELLGDLAIRLPVLG